MMQIPVDQRGRETLSRAVTDELAEVSPVIASVMLLQKRASGLIIRRLIIRRAFVAVHRINLWRRVVLPPVGILRRGFG